MGKYQSGQLMAYPPNVINEYVWFEFFRQNDKKRETISIRAWDYPNKRLCVQAKAMLAKLTPQATNHDGTTQLVRGFGPWHPGGALGLLRKKPLFTPFSCRVHN